VVIVISVIADEELPGSYMKESIDDEEAREGTLQSFSNNDYYWDYRKYWLILILLSSATFLYISFS